MNSSLLKREIEAVLVLENGLVSEQKLLKRLADFDVKLKQLRELLLQLNQDYVKANLSFCIQKIEDNYQISIRQELNLSVLQKYRAKKKKLPTGVLETLVIIAYRQPVTRGEVESLRGVNCGYPLKMLLTEGLIEMAGRKKTPGNPLLFATSHKFLQKFGFESLKALPKLEEVKSYDFLESP